MDTKETDYLFKVVGKLYLELSRQQELIFELRRIITEKDRQLSDAGSSIQK